jgi:hypothetical protein
MTTPVEELELHTKREIGHAVHGLDAVIHGLLIACVARGHVFPASARRCSQSRWRFASEAASSGSRARRT